MVTCLSEIKECNDVRVQPYGLELGTDFAICGSKGNEFSCVRR